MSKNVDDGSLLLHEGNCQDVDARADCIVTDIPYHVINDLGVSNDTYYPNRFDKKEANYLNITLQEVVEVCIRWEAKSIYIFCATEQLSALRTFFIDAKYATRTGVWHKSNPAPFNGQHLWLSGLEMILFARKKKATFNEFCKLPIWHGPAHPQESEHPTSKPIWLLEKLLLASSSEGDVIGDPFMGGGSTAIAALKNGRRFVGCEMSSKWFKYAAKRLKDYQRRV